MVVILPLKSGPHIQVFVSRLQNSRVFFANANDGPYSNERSGASSFPSLKRYFFVLI